jgi:carotenoid cleavage dioxygenase
MVLPRKGEAKDIKIFKRPNMFCSHVMNAFNEGSKIYFDTPAAKNNMFPFFPDIHGAPFNREEGQSFMTRWTVDYNSKGDEFEKDEPLSKLFGEFPRIDDRYATQPHGHGWLPVTDMSMPFNGPSARASGLRLNRIAHMNFRTSKEATWFCGPDSLIQEPCFVPRTPHAPEGDGYILALVDDIVRNYSDLVILDAQDVEAGPICRIKLPFRLRQGLHGNWADERALTQH